MRWPDVHSRSDRDRDWQAAAPDAESSSGGPSQAEVITGLVFLACLTIGTRLAALPFATTDSGDPVARVFQAWRWLSQPELITHGVWGPLHTYMIALSLRVHPDTVLSPIVLHIVVSICVPILMYLFTREEFGSHSTALLVAISYVFYPLASSNSLIPNSEGPFVLLLLIALLLLAKAGKESGTWRHALMAGLALTAAGMLRYEGWPLIPLLGVLLWKKPRFMVVFVLSAALHPVFWMIGNTIQHGDPLYSIHWAMNWEINRMGRNDNVSLHEVVRRAIAFPTLTLLGVTPIIAGICLVGAFLTIKDRKLSAWWLVPFFGVVALLSIGAIRGSLVLKPKYTTALGTMLFPFAAEVYGRLGFEALRKGMKLVIVLLIVGGMILFWSPPFVNSSRFVPFFQLPAVYWVPRMDEQSAIQEISKIVNANLTSPTDGYVSDFMGWPQTFYVAWMTRIHPDRIFVAPGARHDTLSVDDLTRFVEEHPTGTLLLRQGSRFERSLGTASPNRATIGGHEFTLDRRGHVQRREYQVVVYRYSHQPGNPRPDRGLR